MLRVTDDLLELRCWAEERRGTPCRREDGSLAICFTADPAPWTPVGWGEFEVTFAVGRCVLVYDDSPGYNEHFVGSLADARAYVARAEPHLSGAAGPTP